MMFNETKLREEIVKQWGPAGAHVDVLDALLKRSKQYNQLHFYVAELRKENTLPNLGALWTKVKAKYSAPPPWKQDGLLFPLFGGELE